MRITNAATIIAGGLAAFHAGSAGAEDLVGKPHPLGTGFQEPATDLMEHLVWVDTFLHWISAIIVVFVCALLLIVIFRYGEKKNPTPARFTHNAVLEVVWTGVPIVTLVVIGAFSLPLLFKQLNVPEADVTLKATGNQWYWSYSYPDEEIEFDALLLPKEELAENGYSEDEHLLATDAAVIVPVNKNVHVLVTGADVIHAWTVPAFGVKVDAVPGRMNELWFKAEKTGTFFGQCSELCGKDHSYMPITVKVVSQEDYDAWVNDTRQAQGLPPKSNVKVALAE